MVYNYLLDLYRVLAERQAEILKIREQPAISSTDAHHLEGRLTANIDFLNFLKETYHTKLPRRLQKE